MIFCLYAFRLFRISIIFMKVQTEIGLFEYLRSNALEISSTDNNLFFTNSDLFLTNNNLFLTKSDFCFAR